MAIKLLKEFIQEKANTAQKSPPKKAGHDTWIRTETGWLVRFIAGGKDWTLRLIADSGEKNWSFSWYKTGEATSNSINKLGLRSDWADILEEIIKLLREFIRLYIPQSIRLSGLTYKSNTIYYRYFYKLMKSYRFIFRKNGYKTSFDPGNFEKAPVFIISKLAKTEKEDSQKQENPKDK